MKNLTILYIAALTVIALVIILSQYLVQKSIADSQYDSRTINVAGRQSMLSQKIAKSIYSLISAESQKKFDDAKNELRASTLQWEEGHSALQFGSQSLELNSVNNSDKTLLLFLELEPHYNAIKNASSSLLKYDWESFNADTLGNYRLLAAKVFGSEDDYLGLMNQIILDYDEESKERITLLSRTEYFLLAIALFLLVLEAVFIFRPAINRIVRNTHQLEQKEESLQQALRLQKEESAKVEFLNYQARSIFENVDQGLFLLDRKFNINELHSKALESIFQTSNLSGENFVQLLRPRLVKRDIEALEMFMKHLFNPAIEEEMLKKLNPVDKVQLYPQNMHEAMIEPKHIRISFSRIMEGNKVFSILVNIVDETENIVMQRMISDAEERNKKESNQLLSILRVDPVALREFLAIAKDDLKLISDTYETDNSRDFNRLIIFTFNIIHKLKGNATLIDVQILVERFHEMEDTLTKLKNKDNLQGGDFLKVLYEINDTILIITNMQRMLLKITEVNVKLNKSNNLIDTTKNIQTSLQKGIERLGKEMGKNVVLNFNDRSVVLKERFAVAVNDILIQLVRNSLVHGIESEDERIKLGKTPLSNINIEFEEAESGNYVITYEDDGRGLNLDNILAKALEKNLINKSEIGKLDNDQIAMLIFNENFSTAEKIDEHAGRGFGMHLVKQIIEQNNGHFDISYTKGKGFKFRFSMPLDIPQTVLS